MQAVCPELSIYFPASHGVHASTFDAVEIVPAAHAVHELAPAKEPVFVIEPASHVMQPVEFDEYSPAAHAVHVVAPAAEPVSVVEPAAHSEQYDFPATVWNWPAAQAEHDSSVG